MGEPVNKNPRYDHEVVPEAHSQVAGRTHATSTRSLPMCRVSNAGRRVNPRDEGLQALIRSFPYLTGQYVEAKGRYNLFVNQVGLHLEVLVAFIDAGRTGTNPKVNDKVDERLTESLLHLQGDMIEDPHANESHIFFHLTRDWDLTRVVGKLLVLNEGGKRLRLKVESSGGDALEKRLRGLSDTVVERYDDRPGLFERCLAHDTVPAIFRTYHWWALTPQQSRFLVSDWVFEVKDKVQTNLGEKTGTLRELIDHYFTQHRTVAAHVRAGVDERNAEAIDELLLELQSHAQGKEPEDGGIHNAHLMTLATVVRFHLATAKIQTAPEAPERPISEVLQEIANENPGARLKNFERFGFTPTAVQCAFDVEYGVVGASTPTPFIGAGGWAGMIKFTPRPGTTGWPEEGLRFPIAFGTVGVELGIDGSVSAAKSGNGEALSAHTWLPEHIPGPCGGADVSAGAGVGVGIDVGVGHIAVEGTVKAGSPLSPLMCLFSPKSWKKATDAISSGTLGAAIGSSFLKGKIYPPGTDIKEKDVAALLPRMKEENYTRYLKQKSTVHYCTNDAQLTIEAMHSLEVMAALELAAFTSSETKVRIHGYADREGDPEKNANLAAARALNVETYLLDVLVGLEDRGELNASIIARGEGEVMKGPDEVPNPAFRRTDVRLNGQTVLMLEGVPDGVPTEGG